MFKLSNEIKVGLLLFATLSVTLVFAWLLGANNPFLKSSEIYVVYNFAGGIELGSPVRVSGIKVGKVEQITFFSNKEGQAPSSIKMKLSISKEAAQSVRQDSKFYINLAGIIGERYIEITPGSLASPQITNQEVVRGIDPPRIDQLFSQSFDLAGKIKDVIEENEESLSRSIRLLSELTGNINKTVVSLEKSKLFQTNLADLVNNMIDITRDLKTVTAKANTPEGRKTMDLLYKLLWRLEPLDDAAIKKFFQKEGIRTRLF